MRLAPLLALAALAVVTLPLGPLGCHADTEGEDATATDDGRTEDELRGLTLTEADDGKTVTVVKGHDVVVRLPTNPSTGFHWVVAESDDVFGSPASAQFLRNGDAAGAAGLERMTWKTTGKQDTTGTHAVKLEYRRPWEKDASPAKVFSFTVKVVEAECPELSPPSPATCEKGRLEPKKDASGCTTGYTCVPDCRADPCGSGKSCTFCWGQFACVPKGAQC